MLQVYFLIAGTLAFSICYPLSVKKRTHMIMTHILSGGRGSHPNLHGSSSFEFYQTRTGLGPGLAREAKRHKKENVTTGKTAERKSKTNDEFEATVVWYSTKYGVPALPKIDKR